jgi:hypothetical protein
MPSLCQYRALFRSSTTFLPFKTTMVITCRVVTLRDEPIEGVLVSLRCLDDAQYRFEALTDEKGKVSKWFSMGKCPYLWSSGSGPTGVVLTTNDSSWRLCFETGPFLNDESPFTQVRIDFRVYQRSHHDIQLGINTSGYFVTDRVSPIPLLEPDLGINCPGTRSQDEADLPSKLQVNIAPHFNNAFAVPNSTAGLGLSPVAGALAAAPISQDGSLPHSLEHILNEVPTSKACEAMGQDAASWPSEESPVDTQVVEPAFSPLKSPDTGATGAMPTPAEAALVLPIKHRRGIGSRRRLKRKYGE